VTQHLHATSVLIADIQKGEFQTTKFSLLKLIQSIFLVLMGESKPQFSRNGNFIFFNETDCKKLVASFFAALLCNMEAIHH